MPKVILSLLLSLLFVAAPVLAEGLKEDPLHREMLDIAEDLRCAVCQNQPISESNSELARDMRTIIREKLEAGESRDQIVQYFVDRYGNYVLMKPPYTGTGTALWLLPTIFLVLALGVAVFYLRSRLKGEQVEAETAVVTEEERERIRALRKGDE
ncbi:MAG: cytochrome c-type biogenesis protein CcmH [Proteobacteria bacterium]|nr:cytochrome c-type biogenesis protein CcmH [Pseudomonadota bacterium]